MSNLVFPPAAAGLAYGWPVKKTPVYKTIVQTPATGRGELRLGLTPYPRWQFSLDVTYLQGDYSLPSSAFATLVGFFMAAQGSLNDWLYEDPYDNTVTAMPFGVGDGTTTAFQLTRQLASGATDIVQNLNGAPSIFINGTLQTSGYSISSTGLVTFTSAPPANGALTWTGGFYFRCRFNNDSLDDLSEDLYQIWALNGLKFSSVIL